jgi:DeoR/GlpR family transcriptional regulator of sugar metabolism
LTILNFEGDHLIREERFEKIIDYVQKRHFVSIDELIEMLGVSKATVRRDIMALSQTNKLLLTRGGITCELSDRDRELAYHDKYVVNAAEKNRLGQAASEFIHSKMTVIIDAGTTTRSIVSFLKDVKDVNLVTNDLMIAGDLTDFDGIDVTVAGGKLRKGYYTLLGYVAEDFIRHMRVDIVFVGFDAIDISAGCFITNVDEVAYKRRIIESSETVVAVCDYTKFTNTAFISVCPLSDIDVIITNKELDSTIAEALRQTHIELILV